MTTASNIRAFANASCPAENFRTTPVLEGNPKEVFQKAINLTRNGRKHKKLLLVNSRNETLTVLLGYVPARQLAQIDTFLA